MVSHDNAPRLCCCQMHIGEESSGSWHVGRDGTNKLLLPPLVFNACLFLILLLGESRGLSVLSSRTSEIPLFEIFAFSIRV